jgi:hypothetical protein
MRLFLVTAFLLLALSSRAQNDVQVTEGDKRPPVTEDKDSVRRYYIKQFPRYFFLYPVLKQRSLNFELAKTDGSSVLTFKPNNAYSLGLGLYVFEVGLELAFAIPLNEQSIQRYGESVTRDIHVNLLSKRWGVDAFFQRYSGFYLVDKEHEPLATEPFPQRADIGTRNFGATGHYIFNNQKFSFRAAYNFSERQLLSRGSFLLFAAVNTFRVSADSSIVSENRRVAFGPDVQFTRLRYTTFSIAPGYTYSLTYHNFFLNTTLTWGPAHHWVQYNLEASSSERYDIAINSFLGARVAIGYNGYRIFGGISFISQGSAIRFEDVSFSNNNSSFKVLVGYRFREVGILKKRLPELLSFDR